MRDPLVEAFDQAIKRARPTTTEWPPQLFHYTTAGGFEAIVRTRSVRATNFSFMNDPSEISYGQDLIIKLLNDKRKNGSNDTFNELLEIIAKDLQEAPLPEIYVTSFTFASDDLSQWRAYGGTPARYALGFPTKAVHDATLRDYAHPIRFSRVVYERTEQELKVNAVLDAAETAFPEQQVPDLGPYIRRLSRRLVRLLPTLKEPAYEAENEIRIIILKEDAAPDIDPPAPGVDVPEVEFDTSRGVIRPYLMFALTAGTPLPLNSLHFLAPARPSAAEKGARLVLQRFGITGVVPSASQIPFAD
jgi:hypothetical protein